MSYQQQIQTALASWEQWNDLGVEGRAVRLKDVAVRLDGECQKMALWQIDNALELIAGELELPGPTGEANHLLTAGRGLFVCGAAAGSSATAQVGQIMAALVAGNVVLALGEQAQPLAAQLHAAGVPAGVIQALPAGAIDSLPQDPAIAGLAWCGNAADAIQLNRQLAGRGGALAQLVVETDGDKLPLIGSRHYLLRFITERTRTNNTTAVGGNATLLELGGD